MSHAFVRLAAIAVAIAAPLQAGLSQQSNPQGSAQESRSSRTRVFAINPLGIPFEIVSVEFEAGLHGAFTVAANFSYFSPDDFTRSSFEVKGRLYPNEQAPRAFSVGLGLGGVNTREHVDDLAGGRTLRDKTHPSIAVYVDYNWLLGRSDRFFVGTGVGAKRILGDSDEFDAPFVYGTARFLIGVAF